MRKVLLVDYYLSTQLTYLVAFPTVLAILSCDKLLPPGPVAEYWEAKMATIAQVMRRKLEIQRQIITDMICLKLQELFRHL